MRHRGRTLQPDRSRKWSEASVEERRWRTCSVANRRTAPAGGGRAEEQEVRRGNGAAAGAPLCGFGAGAGAGAGVPAAALLASATSASMFSSAARSRHELPTGSLPSPTAAFEAVAARRAAWPCRSPLGEHSPTHGVALVLRHLTRRPSSIVGKAPPRILSLP
jgi:hypothetical protein